MKNLKIVSFLLGACVLFGSCQKSFMDPNININPNQPVAVNDAGLLPSAIVPVAYNTGGSLSWYTSMWDQQTIGIDRQFQNFENFSTQRADVDNIWTNIYQDALSNAVVLNQQATREGNVYYAGIAKVLIAYQMGLTTDLWGDVPYSNAFKGAAKVLTPTFDKQQDVYASLFKLLDSAKTQLGAAKGGSLVPGADDVSNYGGSAANWLKLANVLTARLAIHLVKVDPTNSARAIAVIAAGGFTSNADNFAVKFGTDQNSNNPNYQLNSQRAGYLGYGGLYLPHAMFVLKDPRLAVFVPNYSDAAATGNLGDYFGTKKNQGAPVVMVTFAEQNFILAEAYNRTGNAVNAQNAFNAGIAASMSQFGIDNATAGKYIAANGTLPADPTAALQAIMTQKYFALYLNPEAYTDWRRTGYPVLTSPVAGTAIPRRFLYPEQEYNYNKANVPQDVNLTTKVYWDK